MGPGKLLMLQQICCCMVGEKLLYPSDHTKARWETYKGTTEIAERFTTSHPETQVSIVNICFRFSSILSNRCFHISYFLYKNNTWAYLLNNLELKKKFSPKIQILCFAKSYIFRLLKINTYMNASMSIVFIKRMTRNDLYRNGISSCDTYLWKYNKNDAKIKVYNRLGRSKFGTIKKE